MDRNSIDQMGGSRSDKRAKAGKMKRGGEKGAGKKARGGAEGKARGGDGDLLTKTEFLELKKKERVTRREAAKIEEYLAARKKARRKRGWIIFGVMAILIGGGIAALMMWGDSIISRLTGGQSGIFDAISTVVEETYEPLKTDPETGRTNILLIGTSGWDMEGTDYDGTNHGGAALADSIMTVSFDQETGDVAMLSLPRDLKVENGCMVGKVNEVYTCANPNDDDEEAGAKALQETVGEILGVTYQYYAHVDWAALAQIVDAIGGVTVTVDEDVDDVYFTGAHFEAGVPTKIDGEGALKLARARHGTTGGDFSRGENQQKILIGIKDKLLQEGVTLTQAIALVNALGDNLRTDFTASDIKTGVHLLTTLNFDSMRTISLTDYENGHMYLTSAMIDGISYVIPVAGDGIYWRIQQYVAEEFQTPRKECVPDEENGVVCDCETDDYTGETTCYEPEEDDEESAESE